MPVTVYSALEISLCSWWVKQLDSSCKVHLRILRKPRDCDAKIHKRPIKIRLKRYDGQRSLNVSIKLKTQPAASRGYMNLKVAWSFIGNLN